ncbi:MAG: 50S ribosomal protein L4 [Candidatus Stahlbacteria bacterium]|nr:50S ribosomal protein L4 [Candidatus Stahlbacteria bacterium]
MAKLNIYSKEGKIIGEKELPAEIFEIEPNKEVIYEAIKMYQANKRQGTANTKTRGKVEGSGRKPWKQKHTGRARSGSIRSPIWVGGGTVFGPATRSYYYRMPQKKLKLALLSTMAYKLKESKILILDEIEFAEPKTKLFCTLLQAMGLTSKKEILFVPQKVNQNTYLAGRNIKNVNFKRASDINALDVAKADVVVFPLNGLEAFIERVSLTSPSPDKSGIGV